MCCSSLSQHRLKMKHLGRHGRWMHCWTNPNRWSIKWKEVSVCLEKGKLVNGYIPWEYFYDWNLHLYLVGCAVTRANFTGFFNRSYQISNLSSRHTILKCWRPFGGYRRVLCKCLSSSACEGIKGDICTWPVKFLRGGGRSWFQHQLFSSHIFLLLANSFFNLFNSRFIVISTEFSVTSHFECLDRIL